MLQKGQDRNNITSYIAKQGVLNAGDSTYIRTFQTTPEYLPVNSTQFNQALTLNPSALLKNPKNAGQKFVNLFSTFSNLQLSKKIYSLRSNKAYEYFLPFSSKTLDTNLVQLTINSRNSLFINRFSSKINAQIDVNYLKSKTLLTSGNEIRISQNQSLTIRWNIYKELLLQSSYNHGTKANLSDFYLTQQYNINLHETSNELSYLYRNMIRLAFTYGFAQFIAAPVLGALSDRYGRRPVLLLGFCGIAINFFTTALAGSTVRSPDISFKTMAPQQRPSTTARSTVNRRSNR